MATRTEGRNLHIKVYYGANAVSAILDVIILRAVQPDCLREVLFDYAKGLIDSISAREDQNAFQKRRIAREMLIQREESWS